MTTGLLYFEDLGTYMEAVKTCLSKGLYFEGCQMQNNRTVNNLEVRGICFSLEITGVRDYD